MSGFRSPKWDPWLIVNQIVALQTLYYIGLGIWVFIITLSASWVPTLDYLFSYQTLQASNWSGRLFSGVFLINAFPGAMAIVYLVGRYKQCLDFTLTIHFYHFLACWIYNSQYPNTVSWYVTQFFSVVTMTILSEHFCKKSELRTIPLSSRVDL